jgi:hypothetical protein
MFRVLSDNLSRVYCHSAEPELLVISCNLHSKLQDESQQQVVLLGAVLTFSRNNQSEAAKCDLATPN